MKENSGEPNLPRPRGRGAGSSWRRIISRARALVDLSTSVVKLGVAVLGAIVAANSMPPDGHEVTKLAAVLHEIVSYLSG